MAWVTPRTWVSGELVTEGMLNQHVRDNLLILKTPINDSGKIHALSSTYFASLDGTSITGLPLLASENTYTDGVQSFNGGSGTRVVGPVGTDYWAT